MSEQLDLEAIKRRMAAATPGPWHTGRDATLRVPRQVFEIAFERQSWGDPDFDERFAIWDRNAEFIGHAREDIQALVAEVERLRGER